MERNRMAFAALVFALLFAGCENQNKKENLPEEFKSEISWTAKSGNWEYEAKMTVVPNGTLKSEQYGEMPCPAPKIAAEMTKRLAYIGGDGEKIAYYRKAFSGAPKFLEQMGDQGMGGPTGTLLKKGTNIYGNGKEPMCMAPELWKRFSNDKSVEMTVLLQTYAKVPSDLERQGPGSGAKTDMLSSESFSLKVPRDPTQNEWDGSKVADTVSWAGESANWKYQVDFDKMSRDYFHDRGGTKCPAPNALVEIRKSVFYKGKEPIGAEYVNGEATGASRFIDPRFSAMASNFLNGGHADYTPVWNEFCFSQKSWESLKSNRTNKVEMTIWPSGSKSKETLIFNVAPDDVFQEAAKPYYGGKM